MSNKFEAPESRNEAILQNILGADNNLLPPESRIETLLQMILEQSCVSSSGSWMYRIYSDNTFEAWCKAANQEFTINNEDGSVYKSALSSLALPPEIYEAGEIDIRFATINISNANYVTYGVITDFYTTGINYYAMSNESRSKNSNYLLTSYVFGKINEL